uniref:Immunoglobulin domain-containing protein n=1 Tax=Gopherus evgoodei TaxID=1825980 RepID=A0A8C4YFN9_9SAUR
SCGRRSCVFVHAELYPKPSICVSPRGVMAMVGGTVIIQCECRYQGLGVVLYKRGDHTMLQHIENAGDMTKFLICNVTQDDSRSYTCCYSSTSQAFIWSDPSDPVQLVVRGEGPGLESPLSASHRVQPSQSLCPKGMLRARICPGALWRGCPARDQEISGFVLQPGETAAAAVVDVRQREGGTLPPGTSPFPSCYNPLTPWRL